MTTTYRVPKFGQMMNPVLRALHELGGSGSNNEIREVVIRNENLPNSVVNSLHNGGPKTELDYRLGWARTYLKAYGLLDNSERGIWSLSKVGRSAPQVNPREVINFYLGRRSIRRSEPPEEQAAAVDSPEPNFGGAADSEAWKEQLVRVVKQIEPGAFERLCQRMLREGGFDQVRVTGTSGDGGIDGTAIVRLNGLIGFPVVFQCKRYAGSVPPSVVRDFRGAMQGRADKGIIITTGNFTSDARREATRDGVPPIDLIDGEALAGKLKDLRLGVTTRLVEEVDIDEDWFDTI